MTDSDTTDDAPGTKVHVTEISSNRGLSKAENSTQLAERRIQTLGVGIKPPYNPDRLAAFMELNETHAVAVRKKSRYEVGFGFDIVPVDDVDPDDASDDEREAVTDFWRGRSSRWQTGPHQSAEPTTPEEVLELARQDYHSIGWLCLEILVDAEGDPVGLAHVPANTVRVRKPRAGENDERAIEHDAPGSLEARGYVQIRHGRRRFFGVAGDRYRGRAEDDTREPVFVDRETGDVATGSAEALDNRPANELIFVRNPSPLEQDYGVPDWVSAIRTITADEAAKDYNREFFDNDTIPRMVVKVTGGELTEESKRDLRQMLHGLREESHRTVVLEVEKFQAGIDEDVEIEIEPLGQGISEEMDFKAFREKNEHEISKVHDIPPILIGVTESSNRANSRAQVHEFSKEVIEPEQHKFAERLYQIIHQQALGVTDWTIEYNLRGADQPRQDARIARDRISASKGTMTVDEARAELDLDPLPDDHDVDGTTLLADLDGGSDDAEPEDQPPDDTQPPPPENRISERDWAEVKADLVTKDPIEQTQFDSSNLDEGLFDFGTNELFLSFKREDGPNSLYAYVDVPAAEWAGLVNAGSAGSYHHDNIRLDFAYIEITNFHDRLPEGPSPDPEDIPEGVPSEI